MSSRPRIDVPLTPADRVTELAGWLMLLLLWAMTMYHYPGLPETIPTHFNAAGKPDDWGSKRALFSLPAVATLLVAGITVLNRYPHLFNYPTVITRENACRPYAGATRMLRFLKLAIAFIFTLIACQTIRTATGAAQRLGAVFLPLACALLLAPVIVFMIMLLNSKSAG